MSYLVGILVILGLGFVFLVWINLDILFLLNSSWGICYLIVLQSPTINFYALADLPVSCLFLLEILLETTCFYTESLFPFPFTEALSTVIDLLDFFFLVGLVGCGYMFEYFIKTQLIRKIVLIELFMLICGILGFFLSVYILSHIGLLFSLNNLFTDDLAFFEETSDNFLVSFSLLWYFSGLFLVLLVICSSFYLPFLLLRARFLRWVTLLLFSFLLAFLNVSLWVIFFLMVIREVFFFSYLLRSEYL
jgi:hypothetical protein